MAGEQLAFIYDEEPVPELVIAEGVVSAFAADYVQVPDDPARTAYFFTSVFAWNELQDRQSNNIADMNQSCQEVFAMGWAQAYPDIPQSYTMQGDALFWRAQQQRMRELSYRHPYRHGPTDAYSTLMALDDGELYWSGPTVGTRRRPDLSRGGRTA